MKDGKILIVMILAALGFQVNAQRATYVHESYNSVREYIHPLRLSHNQVADWSRLNRITDISVRDIERSRGLPNRVKARKIEHILEHHDRRLANILTRRQLNRYYNLISNARYDDAYCPSPYSTSRNQGYNDSYGYRYRNKVKNDNRNGYRNRDYGYDDTSYYDGGRNYRS